MEIKIGRSQLCSYVTEDRAKIISLKLYLLALVHKWLCKLYMKITKLAGKLLKICA